MAIDWTTLIGFGVLINRDVVLLQVAPRGQTRRFVEEFRLLREDVSKLSDKIDKQGEAIVELQGRCG